MRWVALPFGLALLFMTATSVMVSLLVPRSSTPRMTQLVARGVLRTFEIGTSRVRDYPTRDRIWAAGPAVYLVAVLAVWLVAVVVGFGLVIWPFAGGSFADAMRESGSSVFTLGFAAPRDATPTAIVFAAAASGLVIVTLQIAYLPSLYAAFNRRERLVTLLETLAGVPAWGPEILTRYALIDDTAQLGRLYDHWTEWAADLSESHTSYRTLIYFRSPEPMRSWLLALLSVLDAAAIHLALCPQSAPKEARPVLRMGYLALRKIAAASGIGVDHDPRPEDPIELRREEFEIAVKQVTEAGLLPERSINEAWEHFRGWRVNYEFAAYQLAYHLDVAPALWSGRRRTGAATVAPVRPIDRRPQRWGGSADA